MTEENKCTLEELHTKAEIHKQAQSIYESPQLGELFAALAKAQGEMETAKKEANNPFFKRNYADLEAVINCSRPYLSKHGLCVLQPIRVGSSGEKYLCTRLGHSSGQWMESRLPLVQMKPDMQGMGSAITYAKRYAYSAMIGVVTGEDDDGNGACIRPEKKNERTPSFISQSQAKTIGELITQSNDESLLDKVLEYYHINKLSYLPQSAFEECKERIQRYGGKNENN